MGLVLGSCALLLQHVFINEIYRNIVRTTIVFVALSLIYFICRLLFVKKINSQSHRNRVKSRLFYGACFIFLFLMARIWVEGFTHLLAVLGLVSAGLVVTNKESIMNLVGWLVINWRDLFSEDDLIEILHYKGYVKSFGILYFSIYEVSDESQQHITGRVIRIPNGLVANNALINFSQTSNLLEQKLKIIISLESDVEQSIQTLTSVVDDVLAAFYHEKRQFSMDYLRRKHKGLAARITLSTSVNLQLTYDKSAGIELTASYYCFSGDSNQIQQKIWQKILQASKEERLKLLY